MALYYKKSDRWILICLYLCFGPGMYLGSGYKDPRSVALNIPHDVLFVYLIISTFVFIVSESYYLYFVYLNKRKRAVSSIIYEMLFQFNIIILLSYLSFCFVVFSGGDDYFYIGLTLQSITFIIGSIFTYKYCSLVWMNGVFNPNSKRWDFKKMRYSIKSMRLYDNTLPVTHKLNQWQPGRLVSWFLVLTFCVLFSLMLHKKDGHSGSLILDLLFRNDPQMQMLSNGVLVFFITQVFVWFGIIPSFVLKILEIVKICQMENEKGKIMLIKERKQLNRYFLRITKE